MSSRISSALILALALAACSSKKEDQAGEKQNAAAGETASQAAEAKPIPCALAGAKTYDSDCTLEHVTQGKRQFVIVRHPDGGFRRLEVLDGGRKFGAVDGADSPETVMGKGVIEVGVGDDAYLFPHKQPAPQSPPQSPPPASGNASAP